MASAIGGRRRFSRNKGFFFREGRGWYTTIGKKMFALRDPQGQLLKDKDTPVKVLQEARLAIHLEQKQSTREGDQTVDLNSRVTISECCERYLEHSKRNDAQNTFKLRADTLFDFCTGLPPRFREPIAEGRPPSKTDVKQARLHPGFGDLTVDKLKRSHILDWFKAHPGWNGSKRMMLNGVLRALNFCVQDAEIISSNPLKGIKKDADNVRPTYITPAQEQAIYRHGNPDLNIAVRVLIRTGARYGCEFIPLTAEHVRFTERGMEWKLKSKTTRQTGKLRWIRLQSAEPEGKAIIEIVRGQITKYPDGPLFRNSEGNPWTEENLRRVFKKAVARARKHGTKFDAGLRLYSTRHTYAKRTLQGHWTGKPTNIETLSILMGNSRHACWKYYASECENYVEPIWDAS